MTIKVGDIIRVPDKQISPLPIRYKVTAVAIIDEEKYIMAESRRTLCDGTRLKNEICLPEKLLIPGADNE